LNTQFRHIYWGVLITTAIVLLMGWFVPSWIKHIDLYVFVAFMIISGIPHGATDHLIYKYTQEQKGRRVSYVTFIWVYLLAMVAYGLCWYFLPVFSLITFLLISAYHFGQSQLLYVRFTETDPFKWFLYIWWGTTILAGIVLLHWTDSREILANFIPSTFLVRVDQVTNLSLIPWIMAGTTLLLLTFAWLIGGISRRKWLFEELNLIVLMLLFANSSLLMSFAVYFGVWHALASIMTEVDELRKGHRHFSLGTFIREAFPLSLISFVGIGILLLIAHYLGAIISPYLLFFIAISTLTLPHMYFMNKFYGLR